MNISSVAYPLEDVVLLCASSHIGSGKREPSRDRRLCLISPAYPWRRSAKPLRRWNIERREAKCSGRMDRVWRLLGKQLLQSFDTGSRFLDFAHSAPPPFSACSYSRAGYSPELFSRKSVWLCPRVTVLAWGTEMIKDSQTWYMTTRCTGLYWNIMLERKGSPLGCYRVVQENWCFPGR